MGFLRKRFAKPRAMSWDAARSNRLLNDWITGGVISADEEIKVDLLTLRDRSRDLVKNNSEAGRFVSLVAHNVIGHKGIQLQPKLLSRTGKSKPEANLQLKAAWKEWGKKRNCTVNKKLTWLGVQRLVMQSVAQDGDVLIRKVRGFDNDFGFALQLIDADQLDSTINRRPEPGVNEIRMGVEVDEWGAAVAYHILKGHPSEQFGRQHVRVPASDILLPLVPYRIAQTRGIPWLARTMYDTKMLKGYREAEVTASRVAAAKMGFFTADEDAGGAQGEEDETKPLRMDAEPGLLEQLPAGWSFEGWDPSHPHTNFGDFSKSILRSVAAGWDVSYVSLTGDLSDASYASSRVGMLSERDTWRWLQQWAVDCWIEDIYESWLPFARLAGRLDTSVSPAGYRNVDWKPRGWSWVDPQKEIKAAVTAIDNGLNSRQHFIAEQGRDVTEVFDEIADEQQLAREKGLSFANANANGMDLVVPSSNGNGNRLAGRV